MESDPSSGQRGTARFIPEVESLRGIAILLVLLHHADGMLTRGLANGGIDVSSLRAFISGGQSGVSLFFVLSAFCLSLPIFAAVAERRPFSLARFYQRRALRILPAYWTAVVVAAFVLASTPADLAKALPWMFFANGFPSIAEPLWPFSAVWWSLATEMQFYLLLPLLYLAMRSSRARRIGAAALLLYAGGFVAYLSGAIPLGSYPRELAFSHSAIALAPVFLVGILAAWIYSRHGATIAARLAGNPLARRGGGDAAVLLCLAATALLLQWVVRVGYFRAQNPNRFGWHVLEGLCWGSFLLLLLLAPLRSKRMFCNPVLAALGLWSYSIYLTHLPVLQYGLLALRKQAPGRLLEWNPETIMAVFALSALCVALSALTYRWIEKPFLMRKEKLVERPEPGFTPQLEAARFPS